MGTQVITPNKYIHSSAVGVWVGLTRKGACPGIQPLHNGHSQTGKHTHSVAGCLWVNLMQTILHGLMHVRCMHGDTIVWALFSSHSETNTLSMFGIAHLRGSIHFLSHIKQCIVNVWNCTPLWEHPLSFTHQPMHCRCLDLHTLVRKPTFFHTS